MQWEGQHLTPKREGTESTSHHPATPPVESITVNDHPTRPHMSVPLSQEEAGIVRTLPQPARDELQHNIRAYIGQIGKEHGPKHQQRTHHEG